MPLAHGRQRLLLLHLVVHANTAVSSDRLVDALWGESPPATATRSLHNLVSALRKGLGGDRLLTRDHGYLLCAADDEVDALCFEALVERGSATLARGDPEAAAALLGEALDLWRGPALAEARDDAVLGAEAARLDELRLAAVDERVDADLARGRHAELVGELDARVSRHPLRERPRAQLMLALYRSGRQAEALGVYSDARRRLVDELGIEPGPALQHLERAVLEHDPALGAPDALAHAPAHGTAEAPPAAAHAPSPLLRRLRRRPVAMAAAGVLLLLAAFAVVLVSSRGGGAASGLAAVTGDSVAEIDPATNRVVAEVPVGGTPSSVTIDAGAVWVLNADAQTIVRVDERTKLVRTFAVGATPTDVAAGDGALWVAAGDVGGRDLGAAATEVLRVEPDSLRISARAALPEPRAKGAMGLPGQLAVSPGAVWAINGGEDLSRIDARTGRVTATARGLHASAVATGGNSVWALAVDDTTMAEIDTRTAQVRRRVRVPAARLDAIAVGAGAIWATDSVEGTLWRIDPGPQTVSRTIGLDVGGNAVSVEAGAVWVSNGLRGTLTRVDPRTNRVVTTVPVGATPRDVEASARAVWVSLAGGPAAAPARATAHGPRPLPRSVCGGVLAGGRDPQVLIASDLPLRAAAAGIAPVANAIAYVVRRHGFRAGRFTVGYQPCDDSTATSGVAEAAAKCTANAKAFADNPAVVGVVGPFDSRCAHTEIPLLNKAPGGGVALVSPSNSDSGLTQPDPTAPRGALAGLYPTGRRNYARVYPADNAEAAGAAALAAQLGLRRVYVLDDGRDPGRALAAGFRRAARGLGLPVVGVARWDAGGAGFAALARRVAHARADGVFLGGLVGSSGGPLTRVLRQRLGAGVALIAADPFAPVDVLYDRSHGAAGGMYLSVGGLPLARVGARGRQFLRAFGATQPGVPDNRFALYAAAATEVLLDAVARSDGTRASVTRQLLATRLRDSVIGPLRFDANGDVVAPPVTILRVHGRARARDDRVYGGAAIDRVIVPPPAALRPPRAG